MMTGPSLGMLLAAESRAPNFAEKPTLSVQQRTIHGGKQDIPYEGAAVAIFCAKLSHEPVLLP
jgi:hypothetical protein